MLFSFLGWLSNIVTWTWLYGRLLVIFCVDSNLHFGLKERLYKWIVDKNLCFGPFVFLHNPFHVIGWCRSVGLVQTPDLT